MQKAALYVEATYNGISEARTRHHKAQVTRSTGLSHLKMLGKINK